MIPSPPVDSQAARASKNSAARKRRPNARRPQWSVRLHCILLENRSIAWATRVGPLWAIEIDQHNLSSASASRIIVWHTRLRPPPASTIPFGWISFGSSPICVALGPSLQDRKKARSCWPLLLLELRPLSLVLFILVGFGLVAPSVRKIFRSRCKVWVLLTKARQARCKLLISAGRSRNKKYPQTAKIFCFLPFGSHFGTGSKVPVVRYSFAWEVG
jgi:hypothetical protein